MKVTSLNPGEQWHGWPRLLPDGRHFLYLVNVANSLDRQLVMAALDSTASSVVLRNVSEATLLDADSLLYVRDGRLLTQKFDASKGTTTGEASLIADDVAYWYPSSEAEFDGANGVIVYRTNTSTGSLVISDRTGKTKLIDDHGPFDDVSLNFSPDGKRAAATVINRGTGLGDIWIYDLARGVRDRFTNEPCLSFGPVWSPDGRSIVYSTVAGTPPHLVRRAPMSVIPRVAGDWTNAAETELFHAPADTLRFAASPDGQSFLFIEGAHGAADSVFHVILGSQ